MKEENGLIGHPFVICEEVNQETNPLGWRDIPRTKGSRGRRRCGRVGEKTEGRVSGVDFFSNDESRWRSLSRVAIASKGSPCGCEKTIGERVLFRGSDQKAKVIYIACSVIRSNDRISPRPVDRLAPLPGTMSQTVTQAVMSRVLSFGSQCPIRIRSVSCSLILNLAP